MEAYVNENNIKEKTSEWLKKIEPFNAHRLDIGEDKAALLVIDMQNFFLAPDSPTFVCGGEAILPNVKRLLDRFRSAGLPVIYTCHVHHPDKLDAGIMDWWWEGMCIEGSEESKVDARIAPLPLEKVIYKHRYSAFYNTDLETVLRCLKVETLVISGVMSNMCCESTARDAYYRDYKVIFPADATASVCEEMHIASLLNLGFGFAWITTTDDVIDSMNI